MTQTYNVSATTTTQKHTGIHGLRGKVTAFFSKKKEFDSRKGKRGGKNHKSQEKKEMWRQSDTTADPHHNKHLDSLPLECSASSSAPASMLP
jgi:hypothetical protein